MVNATMSSDIRLFSFYNLCRMITALNELWNGERGQSILEYAILVALLVLAGVSAMKGFAVALGSSMSSASSNLTSLR
jgi:hypothetical protein